MMGQTQNPPLSATTLVRSARQLLTLRGPAGPRRGNALGELGIVPDGAVLIRDGKILEAGPSRRVENLNLARGAREINAAGRVVMPGFVDSWTLPGFAPGLRARRLETRAQPVLDGMVRHGTTTVAINAGEVDVSRTMATLRTLHSFGAHTLNVVPGYRATARVDAGAICFEVFPLLARRVPEAVVSVNCSGLEESSVRQILGRARELEIRAAVEAAERGAAVKMAVEMQVAAMVIERLDSLTIADLMLARPVCTLLPGSIFREPGGQSARALIEAGAAVALASGFGSERCPTYNMQMVISLACAEMGMSPAEAISAATINGAHALARGHVCGSLEPTKAADLLVLNVCDYREVPEQFGINHVHMVLRRGLIIYQEGEVRRWTSE